MSPIIHDKYGVKSYITWTAASNHTVQQKFDVTVAVEIRRREQGARSPNAVLLLSWLSKRSSRRLVVSGSDEKCTLVIRI